MKILGPPQVKQFATFMFKLFNLALIQKKKKLILVNNWNNCEYDMHLLL